MTSPSSTRVTRSDDRGVGAIWLAVGMTLFMAFAGMAVDLGNWYLTRTEVQTATDAAALAGSALLPADTKAAGDEARRVAANHGFPSDRVEIEIIDGSIMRVRITGEADNFFLPAIGFGQTQVVSAEALAEYEGNVAMGSPENAIGNDPESTGVQPDFTLGVEGPGYTKVNGDRFQPNDCGSSSVSYCDNTSGGIQNEEFDSHGYFFAVNVAAANGQDLVFDVYDPAYVTGNNGNNNDRNCDNFLPSSTQRSNLEDLTDDGADYVGYDGGIIPEHWYNDTDVTVSKADASRSPEPVLVRSAVVLAPVMLSVPLPEFETAFSESVEVTSTHALEGRMSTVGSTPTARRPSVTSVRRYWSRFASQVSVVSPDAPTSTSTSIIVPFAIASYAPTSRTSDCRRMSAPTLSL